MRIGLMIGPDRGHKPTKAQRMVDAAVKAEEQGFASIWVPQIPYDFDALTAIALMGNATSRVELGTAVMVLQTRHPIAMAQQVLSNQAICAGRFTLGLGPSHHWIVEDMLGLSYEKPAQQVRDYLDVLEAALAGPGRVDVDNDGWRVHNDLDITDYRTPVLLAALAPVMLRIAGERANGTILWMADERAISDHVVPRITKAAADAGRPAPRVVAGIPVVLCRNEEVDGARELANEVLGHADYSPNYQRLLEHGDATDVGDMLAGGDEKSIAERINRFRDAGVTDLSVRVLPLGTNREEKLASWARTQAFVASLC
ncbi:MAG TPA: TIGR03564 family F420-dependent LLM class oxidoreductase [Acidimicrobiia bacterium]|nr:TIGR03564 family F420-dependent LLM class oxidoreductase [Acidimicrobiia bacterium]